MHIVINPTFDVTMTGKENFTHIRYIKDNGCLEKT